MVFYLACLTVAVAPLIVGQYITDQAINHFAIFSAQLLVMDQFNQIVLEALMLMFNLAEVGLTKILDLDRFSC